MEHKLVTGGYEFIPFARSRIAALKKLGLPYADQSFEINGTSIKVRIEPGHEYIRIEGGDRVEYLEYLCEPHSTDNTNRPALVKFAKPLEVTENTQKLAGLVDWKGSGGKLITYDHGLASRYPLSTNDVAVDRLGAKGEARIYVNGVETQTDNMPVTGAGKHKQSGKILITTGSSFYKAIVMAKGADGWTEVCSIEEHGYLFPFPWYFSPDGSQAVTLARKVRYGAKLTPLSDVMADDVAEDMSLLSMENHVTSLTIQSGTDGQLTGVITIDATQQWVVTEHKESLHSIGTPMVNGDGYVLGANIAHFDNNYMEYLYPFAVDFDRYGVKIVATHHIDEGERTEAENTMVGENGAQSGYQYIRRFDRASVLINGEQFIEINGEIVDERHIYGVGTWTYEGYHKIYGDREFFKIGMMDLRDRTYVVNVAKAGIEFHNEWWSVTNSPVLQNNIVTPYAVTTSAEIRIVCGGVEKIVATPVYRNLIRFTTDDNPPYADILYYEAYTNSYNSTASVACNTPINVAYCGHASRKKDQHILSCEITRESVDSVGLNGINDDGSFVPSTVNMAVDKGVEVPNATTNFEWYGQSMFAIHPIKLLS